MNSFRFLKNDIFFYVSGNSEILPCLLPEVNKTIVVPSRVAQLKELKFLDMVFFNPSDTEGNHVNNLYQKSTRQSVQYSLLSHSWKFSKSDKFLPFVFPKLRILSLQIANTSPGVTGLIPLVRGKGKDQNDRVSQSR